MNKYEKAAEEMCQRGYDAYVSKNTEGGLEVRLWVSSENGSTYKFRLHDEEDESWADQYTPESTR